MAHTVTLQPVAGTLLSVASSTRGLTKVDAFAVLEQKDP